MSEPERKPGAHSRPVSRIIGFALLGASTIALALLYRSQPNTSPVATPISFYVGTPSAWLLRVMLATDGLGVIVIAWSMTGRDVPKRAVQLIGIGGGGLLLAAVADSDLWFPWQRRLTLPGTFHAIGAGIAVLIFPVGAWLFTRAITRRTTVVHILDGLSYLFFAGLVGFGAATLYCIIVGRPTDFLGLAEQLFFSIASIWLVIAAAARVDRSGSD